MSIEYDFHLDFEGLTERLLAHGPTAAAKGLQHIKGVAQSKTPVETGHLVGSADVTVVGLTGSITFAGPYARRQHYELDWHHNVGQALYLEQPMFTEANTALAIMATELRRGLT